MSHLSKKVRKQYSRLIVRKLESLGVENKISFRSSGVKKEFLKRDNTGNVIMKDGKPETFELDMPEAHNPLRNMLKRLLNSTEDAILAFLNTAPPVPAEKGSSEQTTTVS